MSKRTIEPIRVVLPDVEGGYYRFGDLPQLIAEALRPDTEEADADPQGSYYVIRALDVMNYEKDLPRAATLPPDEPGYLHVVENSASKRPLEWRMGAALDAGLVHLDWLNEWGESRNPPFVFSTAAASKPMASSPPNQTLFHPDLVDREFGSHLIAVPKLTDWAAKRGLEVDTQPPIEGFRFVQVEAFLCAIERAAREGTRDEQQAAAIIQATPHLAHDRAAEVAPRWLVGADAHMQWRRLLERAVEAGELVLLHFGSKLPIEARTEPQAAPVVADSAADGEAWKAKARERAGEIIKRQRAKDLHPSQEDIADEIAREFRADGVMGAGGKPLTGAYIKRHALKGISSAQNRQLSTSIRRGK